MRISLVLLGIFLVLLGTCLVLLLYFCRQYWQSIGVARPVLHWWRSACAFLLPLPAPRTEHCGGWRQEQLRLFRGKSSRRGGVMGRSGCSTAYIRTFFPATNTRNHQHQQHQKSPPVTRASSVPCYTGWVPVWKTDIFLFIECKIHGGKNQLPFHRKEW